MTNKQLEKDILKATKRNPSFFGSALAVFSILYGQFIVQVEGYLLTITEPYFHPLPSRLIGALLILAGAIKLTGILTHYTPMRKIGIWSLSGLWSGLFALALTFSFGSGYPHSSYLFNGLVLVICLRVSLRGNYD